MTYRPMLTVFACVSLGIVLRHWTQLPLIWTAGAMAMIATGLLIPRTRQGAALVLMIAAGYALADYDQHLPARDISRVGYQAQDVFLQGVIVSDVESRSVRSTQKMVFEFSAEKVLIGGRWRDVSGRVMVNAFAAYPFVFGQRLILKGRLHKPFDFDGTASYTEYLRRRHIHDLFTVGKDDRVHRVDECVFSPLRMVFRRMHQHWPSIMQRYLSPGEAGIMTAMMTGDRSGIPAQIKQLFVETGTVHILAISGLNMAIIAGVFLFLARLLPLGFRLRVLVALLMVIGYAIMTEPEASIIRSAIMAGVMLSGMILEKEQESLNTLCASAVIILVIYPWQLFDLGFQLTFLCVWTILVVHPRIREAMLKIGERFRRRHRHARPVNVSLSEFPLGLSILDSVSISLTVSVVVGGLIAYHFHIVTPVTVLANLVVVPLTTVVIMAGLALGVVGWVCPGLAPAIAVFVKLLLNAMMAALALTRQLPMSCLFIEPFPILYLYVYFLILLFFIGLLYFPFKSGSPCHRDFR